MNLQLLKIRWRGHHPESSTFELYPRRRAAQLLTCSVSEQSSLPTQF
jgi:hypothetical protein